MFARIVELLCNGALFEELGLELVCIILFAAAATLGNHLCDNLAFFSVQLLECKPKEPQKKTCWEQWQLENSPGLDSTDSSDEDCISLHIDSVAMTSKTVSSLQHTPLELCKLSSRRLGLCGREKRRYQLQQTFSQKFDMIPEEPLRNSDHDNNTALSSGPSESQDEDQSSLTSVEDAFTVIQSNASPIPPTENEREEGLDNEREEELDDNQSLQQEQQQRSASGRQKRSLAVPAAELCAQLRLAKNLPAQCLKKQKYAISSSSLLHAVQHERRHCKLRRSSSWREIHSWESRGTGRRRNIGSCNETNRSNSSGGIDAANNNKIAGRIAVTSRRTQSDTALSESQGAFDSCHSSKDSPNFSISNSINYPDHLGNENPSSSSSFTSSTNHAMQRPGYPRQSSFCGASQSTLCGRRRSRYKHLEADCRLLERMLDFMDE